MPNAAHAMDMNPAEAENFRVYNRSGSGTVGDRESWTESRARRCRPVSFSLSNTADDRSHLHEGIL